MPFCTVYKGEITSDKHDSFEGHFRRDTIYAAINRNSAELKYYQSLREVFDIAGGYALYEIPDYLAMTGSTNYSDIMIYKYGHLFGYFDTTDGRIITPAQFVDAKSFKGAFASVCYEDGRSGLIGKNGNALEAFDAEDSGSL